MPSTIVPILSTREFSLQPAKGLRYGNFEGVAHLPPVEQETGRLSERNVSQLNNQQIYNKICEWFETWKSWQQKLALSGISNRCSGRQLDILATSLEPVRHRDYFTASKHIYPSLYVKSDVSASKEKPKKLSFKKKKSLKIKKKPDLKTSIEVHVAQNSKADNQNKNCQELDSNKKKVSKKSFEKENQKKEFSVENYAESLSSNIVQSSLNSLYPSAYGNKNGTLEADVHKIEKEKVSLSVNSCVISPVCDISVAKSNLKSDSHLFSPVPSADGLCSSQRVSTDNSVSFSFEFMGETLEYNPSSAKIKKTEAEGNTSSNNGRTGSFSFSPVDTLDFFEKEKVNKLGKLQREISDMALPLSITTTDELPVTLPKFYKHIKFWPVTPSEGKHFLKAKRLELVDNFKDQLCHVWMWMQDWEDFEKIGLLKAIMKISNPMILSDLLDHIHQRLEDEKDINRLCDKLLLNVFSFLPPRDICRTSQVCRRWRYLCTSEDLWMFKCLEMGEEEGIRNIPNLVLQTNSKSMLVDWKLAYQELYHLVLIMKASLLNQRNLPKEDIIQDIINTAEQVEARPVKRRHSMMTELKLRRGTLSRIRKQEELTKLLGRIRIHEDDSGDEAMSEEDLEPFMNEYTILPPIDDTNKSFDWCNSSRRSRRRTLRTSLHDIPIDTERQNTNTTDEDRSTKNERSIIRNEEPVEDDDKALDIRPRLVQTVDLLGKTKASRNLEWQKKGEKEDDSLDINKKSYAGSVKSVLRVRKLQGHMNGIMCLQFDKRRLVTAGLDRTIRIWDIRSGRSIHKLYGHKGGIHCLCFNDDILATGSWDCTIVIWNMYQFTKITVLIGHKDGISCIQFTDSYIVTGSYDNTVRVWCRKIYNCCHVIQHKGAVNSFMVVDDNKIVSSSADMCVRLSNLFTGECLKIYDNVNASILSIVVQGSLVLGSDVNGIVYFWNKDSGEAEAAIQAHDEANAIHKLVYHNGRFLTAAADGSIKEWDIMTMTCVRLLQGHKGPVRDVKVMSV
ncbi:hypothetical protein SNE40_010093 [Patella caerulea]|uniref:F-box domain-containing protein n=1 Tax=Patella caerulea TaxID=87958 RepID=A0AAN8JV91_PATCE